MARGKSLGNWSRLRAGSFRFTVLCALFVASTLCVLEAVQPPNATAGASKPGAIAFDVVYNLHDRAEWSFDLQEECGRSTGRGRQIIQGVVSPPTALLQVKMNGSRVIPDPKNSGSWVDRQLNDLGTLRTSVGAAQYELESDREETSNSGPDCPEPIICNECSSAPPVKSCGVRGGTVTLRPDIGFRGKTAYIRLEDEWNEPDPFNNESQNTYCPGSMALWTWGSNFPATSNPEGDQVIKLDTNRLMGFNRLTKRQKAKCASRQAGPRGEKLLVYERSRCGNGNSDPAWMEKADYTRSVKTILLRNDPPPKRWEVEQTSRLKIEYFFRYLTIELGK